MSNEKIRVQFETTKAKLATILPLLSGEVENIATRSMADILSARVMRNIGRLPEPKREPVPPPPPVRMKGKLPVHEAVFHALVASGAKAGDIVGYPHITTILVAHGFSPTSISPVVSTLTAMGILRRVGKRGDGTVQVLKLVLPQ